jgi:hypothetical protein
MKNKTGIGNIISKAAAREAEPKRKTRGAGETVGITLRIKPAVWRGLHEAALDEQTNVTQLILGWFSDWRRSKGLPPVVG